jgi:hypothetical protein
MAADGLGCPPAIVRVVDNSLRASVGGCKRFSRSEFREAELKIAGVPSGWWRGDFSQAVPILLLFATRCARLSPAVPANFISTSFRTSLTHLAIIALPEES